MKYLNKKRIEKSNWAKVKVPFSNVHYAKVWCQQHPSPYKFYCKNYSYIWRFESAEDATAFSLVWV